jgi:hypothetical protein
MLTQRQELAVAAGGKAYIIGGLHEGCDAARVVAYDPAAARWVAEAPTPRHGIGARGGTMGSP